MKSRDVLVFAMATLVIHGSVEAGEIQRQNGQQVWVSQSCERPLAPTVDKTDAQALNQSISRFNRYVALVDAYNQCLSQEATRDIDDFAKVVNGSVRDLQETAIAGVAVERAALAGNKP